MNVLQKQNVSKIAEHLYLSGIDPIVSDQDYLTKNNIGVIISCVNNEYITRIYEYLINLLPNTLVILIPYDDNLTQNLWQTNNDQIKIIYGKNYQGKKNQIDKLYQYYQNKPMIDIAYHAMNSSIDKGRNVLVHCMAGISRSVSVICYYLMKKYQTTFDNALAQVYHQRSIAKPNDSFAKQLVKYQNTRN